MAPGCSGCSCRAGEQGHQGSVPAPEKEGSRRSLGPPLGLAAGLRGQHSCGEEGGQRQGGPTLSRALERSFYYKIFTSRCCVPSPRALTLSLIQSQTWGGAPSALTPLPTHPALGSPAEGCGVSESPHPQEEEALGTAQAGGCWSGQAGSGPRSLWASAPAYPVWVWAALGVGGGGGRGWGPGGPLPPARP